MGGFRDQIIILSEVHQIKVKIMQYHQYVESNKNDTEIFIHKTETDSKILKPNF